MRIGILKQSAAPAAVAICAFALALSVGAFAQSGKVYRIGMLEVSPASANRANLDALLRGLRERGYVEGKNLVLDYRSSDGHPDRFKDLAADLVRARPDIIVTRGTAPVVAAKDAGPIPIVMAASADPVGARLVASLARPGGNITGLTALVSDVTAKRVEILKALVPGLAKVGAPLTDSRAAARQRVEIERATRALGLQPVIFELRGAEDLAPVFERAAKEGVGAIIGVFSGLSSASNRRAVVELAAKHRIAVIYSTREAVDAGGLVSYGVHYPDLYYRAASYVDKILKGAKPGDLPIEQPTKLELVINLKTAKALGLNIPRDFLLRADEVIQ